MTKQFTAAVAAVLFAVQLTAADTSPKDPYHMFPQASERQNRFVIEVPRKENENDYRLQLLVGKRISADCNMHGLSAKIEKKLLKGWGYHYYTFSNIHEGPHTMMACMEPKQERFLSVYTESLLRYNSRLGTVVYVPKGYEVRYRIWKAGEEQKTLQR